VYVTLNYPLMDAINTLPHRYVILRFKIYLEVGPALKRV